MGKRCREQEQRFVGTNTYIVRPPKTAPHRTTVRPPEPVRPEPAKKAGHLPLLTKRVSRRRIRLR